MFLLAGTAIYRAHKTKNYWAGAAVIAVLLLMFRAAMGVYETVYGKTLGFDIANSLAAIAIFVTILSAEKFMPRLGAAEFFADISYPLYLVHIPLGWLVLHYLYVKGFDVWSAMVLTAGACTALAYALHLLIERPSERFGRRMASARTSDAAGLSSRYPASLPM